MCRMEVAQENGAHILCQIALLHFALQRALCYWRNGRSLWKCRTVHIFPDSFSVFLPSSLYTRILLAATHSGVVVLRNFRLSRRCCCRFPHFWLRRLGDCCIKNILWEERNVGPYASTYTASRPEWRESGSLLLLLQPFCLLRHRNSGGASYYLVVYWTFKVVDKISGGVIDYLEFTLTFFTFRLSYGSRYTHKWNFNPLTPNGPYSGRTAPLTSKRCILYIYSRNIGTEYFKHGIYSPFFFLQNAVCFIILTYLVPVLFTFYIKGVLKLKKK